MTAVREPAWHFMIEVGEKFTIVKLPRGAVLPEGFPPNSLILSTPGIQARIFADVMRGQLPVDEMIPHLGSILGTRVYEVDRAEAERFLDACKLAAFPTWGQSVGDATE